MAESQAKREEKWHDDNGRSKNITKMKDEYMEEFRVAVILYQADETALDEFVETVIKKAVKEGIPHYMQWLTETTSWELRETQLDTIFREGSERFVSGVLDRVRVPSANMIQKLLFKATESNKPNIIKKIRSQYQDDKEIMDQYVDAQKKCNALSLALAHNSSPLALRLLEDMSPMGIRQTNGYQSTPMHQAAQAGNDVVTRALLNFQELLIDARDRDGNTALHLAVLGQHTRVVNRLARHRARVTIPNNYGQTAVDIANRMEDMSTLQALLQREDGDTYTRKLQIAELVKDATDDKLSPRTIMKAINIYNNRYECDNVDKLILAKDWTEDQRKEMVRRALVAENPHLLLQLCRDSETDLPVNVYDGMQRLIERGIDPIPAALRHILQDERFDVNKPSPSHPRMNLITSVLMNFNRDLFDLLIAKRPDPNYKDQLGRNAIMTSIRKDNVYALRELLKLEDADVNGEKFAESDDLSPLGAAVMGRKHQMIEELLERDDIAINTLQPYYTPLMLAIETSDETIVDCIMSVPTRDINMASKDGNTALHWAVYQGYLPSVQALLRAVDVDVTLRNKIGNTALDIAMGEENFEMFAVMLDHSSWRCDRRMTLNWIRAAARTGDERFVAALLNSRNFPKMTPSQKNKATMGAMKAKIRRLIKQY